MPKGVYDRGPAVRRGVWKKAAKKRAKTMASNAKRAAEVSTLFKKGRSKPKAVAKKSRRRA